MPIFARVTTSTSAGTTIGTFDPLTTRNTNNTFLPGSTALVGMVFSGVRVALTAAEAQSARLRIVFPSLGLAAEDFHVGAINGSGIATNDDGWFVPQEFLSVYGSGQLDNASVNFLFSQSGIESTDNWSIAVNALQQLGGDLPSDWFIYGPSAGSMWYHGGASSNGASFGTTANSNTSLLSTTILAKYKHIVGMRLALTPDPVGTAGEEAVAWCDLGTGGTTIPLAAPNEWPMNAVGPALGTPVGAPVYGTVPITPIYIAKPGGDATLDVAANMIVATTALQAGSYGAFLRQD